MIHRRRHHQHEVKNGHERWLVSYADFITLLFAFFVVMYSVSQVNDQKYRVLSETLSKTFQGKVPNEAELKEIISNYPLDDQGQVSGLSPVAEHVETEVLARDLAQALVHMVKAGDVTILALDDAVAINMNANALFATGSATPSDAARDAFASVAGELSAKDYQVEVAGHTDDVPIRNSEFASNWELSATRATAIVQLLVSGGVAPSGLKAAGYGEYQPIADNSDAEGRAKNRRVVLTVTRQLTGETAPPSSQLEEPAASTNSTGSTAALKSEASNAAFEASRDSQSAPSEAGATQNLAPVRLEDGGLLFSSDPELPRRR